MIWVAGLALVTVVAMYWRPSFQIPKVPRWKIPPWIDVLGRWSNKRTGLLKALLAVQLLAGGVFLAWATLR